jgi:hypothetical protein
VVNPGVVPWASADGFQKLGFFARRKGNDWDALDSPLLIPSHTAPPGATNVWAPGPMPDGEYEIKVVTLCESIVGFPDYAYSSTTVISGVIDRNKPEVVAVASSSSDVFVGVGDVITATYNEPIKCLIATKAYATVGGKTLPLVNLACEGNTISMSIPSWFKDFVVNSAGLPLGETTIKLENVFDVAGNEAEAIAEPLQRGELARKQVTMLETLGRMEKTMVQSFAKLSPAAAEEEAEEKHANSVAAAAELDRKMNATVTAIAAQETTIAAWRVKVAGFADEVLRTEALFSSAEKNLANAKKQSGTKAPGSRALLVSAAQALYDVALDAFNNAKAKFAAAEKTLADEVRSLELAQSSITQLEAEQLQARATVEENELARQSAARAAAKAKGEPDYHRRTWRLVVASFTFIFFLVALSGAGAAMYVYRSRAGNKSEVSMAEQDAWRGVGSLRREVEEAAVDPEEMDRIYEMAQAQQVSAPSDFGGGEASYQMASAGDGGGEASYQMASADGDGGLRASYQMASADGDGGVKSIYQMASTGAKPPIEYASVGGSVYGTTATATAVPQSESYGSSGAGSPRLSPVRNSVASTSVRPRRLTAVSAL